MVTFKDRQFFINGEPRLIMAGEIHYYRLDPGQWQDRITKLKESGLNTVATYVPWVLHEYTQGEFDFGGRFNPRHNLKAFIKLCEDNGLFIFLRPGPFVMAEMLNDGVPNWLYANYPELIPTGFEGKPATTPTLDYLSPNFLKAAKNWYREIIALASCHIFPEKGKILAIQLDNEVGMLSWVSNRPDLTPFLVGSFVNWLKNKYSPKELGAKYPFSLDDKSKYYNCIVSPVTPYDASLHNDLGLYMRDRFVIYVEILKKYAEEFGAKDILFVVNIHGTGGGRGFTYPVGVSQLFKTYANNDNIISGSDVYFDEVKMNNFQDMYLVNGITESTNNFGKPLACVEFGCGDANYGDDYNGRNLAYGNDLKTRLFLANGNKMINYYLFSGGENYRLDAHLGNGLDRIATTGHYHGYAAPIGPDGTPNQTYDRMARVIRQIMSLERTVATSFTDYDSVAYGFIPDYFMTESLYEKAPLACEISSNITRNRVAGWESTIRAFLLLGIKTQTVDIQNNDIPGNLQTLIVSSAKYMCSDLQQKLFRYAENGGNLILQGQIPQYDLVGNPCTLLSEAMKISNILFEESSHGKFKAVENIGSMSGIREVNSSYYECFDVEDAEVILRGYGTQRPCGFLKRFGEGKIIVISCGYKCYLDFYRRLTGLLEVKQTLTHDINIPGIGVFMTETVNAIGERILHILNMDDIPKEFNVYRNGRPVLPNRRIFLPPLDALMLPINVKCSIGQILYSSAEIFSTQENSVSFRNTEKSSNISIKTSKNILSEGFFTYEKNNDVYTIKTDNRLLDDVITINFER